MFSFMFKTTTYYILWKKFNKQIILIGLSLVFIGIIHIIYQDLFQLLKVAHKESLVWLFAIKWILIVLILIYNIKKLKQTKLNDEEKAQIFEDQKQELPKQTQDLLNKEKLISTTDILVKKYKK